MHFLLSLLALFKQWWACRRKASMTRFNIRHHGLVSYCDRWDGDKSHHLTPPTNDEQDTLPNKHLIKDRQTLPYCGPGSLPAKLQGYLLPTSYIGEKKAHLHNTKQMQAIVRRGTDSHSPISQQSPSYN
jgi:hypothetical protein